MSTGETQRFLQLALLLVCVAFSNAAAAASGAHLVFDEWLAAFNSADEVRIKTFKQTFADNEALDETVAARATSTYSVRSSHRIGRVSECTRII